MAEIIKFQNSLIKEIELFLKQNQATDVLTYNKEAVANIENAHSLLLNKGKYGADLLLIQDEHYFYILYPDYIKSISKKDLMDLKEIDKYLYLTFKSTQKNHDEETIGLYEPLAVSKLVGSDKAYALSDFEKDLGSHTNSKKDKVINLEPKN